MKLRRALKIGEFIRSPRFRREKMRQVFWPFFRGLYPNIECVGVRDEHGHILLVHSEDRFITTEMVKYSGLPTSDFSRVMTILDVLGRPKGGYFVDVGANIGSDTIAALLSGRFDRALAIEPETQNWRMLHANLAMNGLSDRVIARQLAVSNREGTARLALSGINRGDHRVIEGSEPPTSHAKGEAISMMTLDAVIRSSGLRPDDVSLVWVDAQGYDGFVLDGAHTLISANVPFVVEFWPAGLRRNRGLDIALDAIRNGFDVYYDLCAWKEQEPQPVQRIHDLAASMQTETASINLLLAKRAPSKSR